MREALEETAEKFINLTRRAHDRHPYAPGRPGRGDGPGPAHRVASDVDAHLGM